MAQKVVVIGAGAVGLYCAKRLAERGAEVTVVDGDAGLGEGAASSIVAAGMLGPIAESENEPPNAHPRATELALASFDLWRAAPASLQAHARFNGALLLGETAHAAKLAEAFFRRTEMLSRDDVAARFGVSPTGGALFLEDEGALDPLPMLGALATALASAGGRVLFEMEAEAIDVRPWLRVRCHGGATFTADHVVLAPGAWARDELQEFAPALRHIRPAKGALATVALQHDLSINVRGDGFYLAGRGDTEAVLGATMEFDSFDRRADPAKIECLRAAAESALPGQVQLTQRPPRAGIRPMSPDWSPMIGRSGADGVLVACGHSRNGWLLAPITAEMICAYVFGDEIPELWSAFAPDRFET